MGAGVAIASLAMTGYSLYKSQKADKAMQEQMAKANEMARAEAEEEKRQLALEKAEKLKERKTLVDQMREQLGVGLGTSNIVSTRFKSGISTAANALSQNTLG